MSKFKSASNSFLHINAKYGVAQLQNHIFIRMLEKYVDNTEGQFAIKKDLAEALITMPAMQDRIMCSEVDMEEGEELCFVQVIESDLHKSKFPEEWINFIVTKR